MDEMTAKTRQNTTKPRRGHSSATAENAFESVHMAVFKKAQFKKNEKKRPGQKRGIFQQSHYDEQLRDKSLS